MNEIRVWSVGAMIMIGENQRTSRRPIPRTTLSTTNDVPGSALGLCGERPATAQPPTCILNIS